MMLPTRVDPVKLTLPTESAAMIASTTAGASTGAMWMTLSTPAGRPASERTCAMMSWVLGEYSDVLRIAVLPAIMGWQTARWERTMGAFQGACASGQSCGGAKGTEWTHHAEHGAVGHAFDVRTLSIL